MVNSKESLWKLYVLATHVCDHIYSRSWDHDYECVVVKIERKKQKYTIQKFLFFSKHNTANVEYSLKYKIQKKKDFYSKYEQKYM